jgi:type II secretory pathway pseudopilin PulG
MSNTMSNTIQKWTNETGASLLEVLVVVGLGLAAVLGVITIGARVQQDNVTQQSEQFLDQIVTEVRSYFELHQNYAVFANNCNMWEAASEDCYLVQKGILRPEQKNPFGGDIAIGQASASEVKVTFENIPNGACEELLLHSNQKQGLKDLAVYAGNQRVINFANDPVVQGQISCTPSGLFDPVENDDGTMNTGFNIQELFIRTAYADLAGGGGETISSAPPSASGCSYQPTNGTESISYSMVLIENFPLSDANAATICQQSDRHTMVWTFRR